MQTMFYQLYAFIALLITGLSLALFGLFLLDIHPSIRINQEPQLAIQWAIFIDLGLVILFGLQHSVMARSSVKAQVERIVPSFLQRSTYLLASSIVLLLLIFCWQGMEGYIWIFKNPTTRLLMRILFFCGVVVALGGAISIRGADLTGRHQIQRGIAGLPEQEVPFQKPWLYRVVRHPIYLGTLIMLWAHPDFSFGHFLLALGMTVYVLIGIYYEERDLVKRYGATYKEYQKRVPRLIPGIHW